MENRLNVYAVHSLTDEVHGDEEYPLAVEWFVVDRNGVENPVVEHWIMENKLGSAEGRALREHFTREEAELLKEYLDMSHSLENFVTELELKPQQHIDVKQLKLETSAPFLDEIYTLHESPEYDLPFIAVGYITDVDSVHL